MHARVCLVRLTPGLSVVNDTKWRIYLFNLKTELATWGGLGVGASFGSTPAVLAHISLLQPWDHGKPGGGKGGGDEC